MKAPSKFPKSLFLTLVFTLVVIVTVRFCLPSKQVITKTQDNQIKISSEKKASVQKSFIQRSISSIHKNNVNTPVTIIESPSIELVKKKYFSFLPKHIKWSVIPVGNTSQGQQVKIRLEDSISGKKTSYHALLESDSGKILTTWHRKIQH